MYFDRTWVNGDFPPSLWTHYDNVGLKTTNIAEGWHNGLNSRFGKSHLSLHVFLDWLQKYQFEVQCRGYNLLLDGQQNRESLSTSKSNKICGQPKLTMVWKSDMCLVRFIQMPVLAIYSRNRLCVFKIERAIFLVVINVSNNHVDMAAVTEHEDLLCRTLMLKLLSMQ